MSDPAQLEWKRTRRRRSRLVADRILERRSALGWSQGVLAQNLAEAGLPMSQASVSRAESGAGLDGAELVFYAFVLRCTTTYLLALTDQPDRWSPEHGLKAELTRVFRPGERPASARSLKAVPGQGTPEPITRSPLMVGH